MQSFPPEIWHHIFDHLISFDKFETKNFGGLLRICRSSYVGGLHAIYYFPKLNPRNYHKFVDTISRKPTRKLVHHISLNNVSYASKASITSRLLRRCATNLETFSGPQSGLGFTALRAFSQCQKLKKIDLSILSEKIDLQYLFGGIQHLKHLEYIILPYLSIPAPMCTECWPSSLTFVGFSGGLTDDFLAESVFPPSLKSINITQCPLLTDAGIFSLLSKIGPNLSSVCVQYPMPELSRSGLDCIFQLCPNATTISIPANYITSTAFESIPESGHNVRSLEITYSGSLLTNISLIKADDLVGALVDGKLPNLHRLQWSIRLGWREESQDVQDLLELIDDQDGEVFITVK